MLNPDEPASAAPSSSTAPQAQALQAQKNITVTNRHLNITRIVIDCDPTNTANTWDKWRKGIERKFSFFGIHEPELKKDGLIIYGATISPSSKTPYQMSKAQTHPLMNTPNSS